MQSKNRFSLAARASRANHYEFNALKAEGVEQDGITFLDCCFSFHEPFITVRMKDFFISYTGIDSQIASWIAWTLEEAGYAVVFQKWDFASAGRSIIGNIHQASIDCERTLAVLSPDYFNSKLTVPEWEAAVKKDPAGKRGLLVPVIVRACEIPGLLDRLAYISLLDIDEEQAKEALLQAIKTERAKPISKPAYNKENQQQHQLNKPRYPGILPPICNLPRRNPNFTGRESNLETLRSSLQNGQNIALTQQALYGLGGIGKTQIAIEYAWRHNSAYDTIWWLRSEESATLASDYAALAKELNLPEKEAQEQAVTIDAVKKWLEHNLGWLLIFDNARDPDTVRSYLPTGTGGHVLITSRYQNWNHIGTPLKIEVWSREESIAFLNKRTSQSDDTAAGNLAKTLGYLPLALEQAAAYCHITKKSYADYLDLFTTRRAELWKREKHPDNYRDTVATTWSLAFQEIEKFPFAADMLNLCSIVAPDAIPRTLIHRALDHHAANNREAPLIDTMQVDDAMEALTNYSLITLEEKQISIHRLVQTVAQDRMLPAAKESYRIAAIKALSKQFPSEGWRNPACWPECAALMPHAETLANAVTGEAATLEFQVKNTHYIYLRINSCYIS